MILARNLESGTGESMRQKEAEAVCSEIKIKDKRGSLILAERGLSPEKLP